MYSALIDAFFFPRRLHPYAREEDNSAVIATSCMDQLQRLSGSIMASQEEERTSIARELHDELGQVLTAIVCNVRVKRAETPAPPFLGGQASLCLPKKNPYTIKLILSIWRRS